MDSSTKTKDHEYYYEGNLVGRVENTLIMCADNLKKSTFPSKTKTVYIPDTLIQKLEEQTVGGLSPKVVALLEYVLQDLEKNNKSLILKKKRK